MRSERLDLGDDGGHDAIADAVEHEERIAGRQFERLRPDDASRPRLGELDLHDDAPAAAQQAAADDVVHTEHAARVLEADAALVEGEHRALGDDEKAAQLGEPGDDVVDERCGQSGSLTLRCAALGERHDGDGGATRGPHRRLPPSPACAGIA